MLLQELTGAEIAFFAFGQGLCGNTRSGCVMTSIVAGDCFGHSCLALTYQDGEDSLCCVSKRFLFR